MVGPPAALGLGMTKKNNTKKPNQKKTEIALQDLPTDANVVGGSAYSSGRSMVECEAGLASGVIMGERTAGITSGVIMGERPTSFRRS